MALVVPYPWAPRREPVQWTAVVGRRRRTVLVGGARPPGRGSHFYDTTMSALRQKAKDQEPVGIVISRGTRDEAAPRFWAYVWGPAPEETASTTESRAA